MTALLIGTASIKAASNQRNSLAMTFFTIRKKVYLFPILETFSSCYQFNKGNHSTKEFPLFYLNLSGLFFLQSAKEHTDQQGQANTEEDAQNDACALAVCFR